MKQIKNRILVGLILFNLSLVFAYGQTLNLTPATMIPNAITITAVNAGELPSNPLVNNTSQSIRYLFVKKGGWGSSDKGTIEINSWWIPNGFGVVVEADSNSGPGQKNGISRGPVNVAFSWKYLITNIQNSTTITRLLTQSVVVTNFSQISIGNYPVTINYRMSW